jgi:LytS/YehU family sensor histidine kinase
VEKYKKESAEAKFQVLKSQINPHFLFNNLSVLSSLVYSDADKAIEFINQFSKVYRYVMESNEKELIELETEISFINSYCYLLHIRFGEGFKHILDINEQDNSKLIPPMALQILVENTIKHNLCSKEFPLLVMLKTDGEYLSISNNKQLKKLDESVSGIGLKNIKKRYHHFTDKMIIIENNDNFFTVKIPLIPAL